MSESDIGGDLPPLDPELAAWLASDTPGPMPEQVWSGIEARLAAEPPLVPAGVVDLQAERTRRRPGKALPLLAGAAGLALVGAVVLPSMQTSSPAPVADGASSAAAVVAGAAPTSAASTKAEDGGVAGAPAPVSSATEAAPAMPRAIVSSGTDYTADTLPTQVTTLLASTGMTDSASVASAMTADPTTTPTPGTGLASDPVALADCLGRLGLPPESVPLVLDTATIDGVDGHVIVTLGAQDASGQPTALHVVTVGHDCTEDDVAAARHWDLPLR